MAKHLLKLKSLEYISRVTVAFNPFDPTSRSARVFLAKVQGGKKLRKSNPKCKIEQILKEDDSPPTVEMEYADGTKDLVEVCNVNWQDLVEQMNDKRAVLEFDANRAKAEKFKPEQFS